MEKKFSDSIAVFNIQKSQWDTDDFYINLGIYYLAIGNDKYPNENTCHLRCRLEIDTPENLNENTMGLFNSASKIEDAKKLAKQNPSKFVIVNELRPD